MTAISKWTMVLALAAAPVLLVTTTESTQAQTFETLQSFCSLTNCADGASPNGQLLLAKDGKFYGTTLQGGVYSGNCPPLGCGTVFKITPGGKLNTLRSLDDADGENPVAGLMQGAGGELYGTTYGGGIYTENCDQLGCGTVFKITTSGKLVTLYSFCSQLASNGDCADGNYPTAGLILAANGNIYGTTRAGGANDAGTVFTISPNGELTTLYTFCSQVSSGGTCTDGSLPFAGLVQATGTLYGVTQRGGTNNAGTVFTITYAGELTTLYSFCSLDDCTDGSIPSAGLIQATDGNFYATTAYGGAYDSGTAFKITSGGALTTLYSFCAHVNADHYCTDGDEPTAGVFQGSDDNFYGTTLAGGADNQGTIFSLTPAGTLTTLHSFCSQVNSSGFCTDGNSPAAGLILGPNGFYYGTTQQGGANGYGTVFKLKP